jgi:YidC/Oxa1 family membrane protein insertase
MDSIFGPLYEVFGFLLAHIYSVFPNLGVSIIVLTIIVMIVLYPLTAKQAKSMIAMQRVQPEVKKLQAKYKGDRQKLNEEMMTFYKENKINPLAGCLPLLVQLPVFIALNGTLRNAYKYVPTDTDLFSKLCGGLKTCTADNFHHLKFLTMDLQQSATDSHSGFGASAPYFVLVLFVMVTSLLQTRQATKRTPAANKQMGAIMKVMPIFFGLISLSFPSGLVLYFFVSNLFRLGQQEIIFRRHGSALHGPGGKAIDVKSRDASGKGTAVKELTSADVDEADGDGGDVEDDTPSGPPQIVRKPAPKQPSATPSHASGSEAPAEIESSARPRGLRGLFALPPPPEYNGGGASGTTSKPSSGQTGSRANQGAGSSSQRSGAAGSGNGRPPQQRRRSNKKKRKR